MSEIDPVKLELYRFVKDEYDKVIGARQGQKARMQSFLVLTGFLVTVVFTFGIPGVLLSLERATSQHGTWSWACLLALSPLIAFAPLVYHLTIALEAIVNALGHVGLNTARVESDEILSAFDLTPLNGNHVIRLLTESFMAARDGNLELNNSIGRQFAVTIRHTRRAIYCVVALVAMTVISRILIYCFFTAASTP